MASADGSVSWAQAFLHGTSRGRALLDELAELERGLARARQDCVREDYHRVAACWLRIVEEASEYAALSTARHYISVLRRFQTGIRAVLDELGRGLDALAPLLPISPSEAPPAVTRRGRHHLRLIDCGNADSMLASAPYDLPCEDESCECEECEEEEKDKDAEGENSGDSSSEQGDDS